MMTADKKFKLLDLYCGAGGAGKGYANLGFEVTGVDIAPQKHYPYKFVQADALQFLAAHGHEYDAIHASPPCQRYSAMTKGRWKDRSHPDLIGATRELLKASGRPYVIENVEGAKTELREPILLCGTMFGRQTAEGSQLRRHRLFECSWTASMETPPCSHNDGSAIGVYGGGQHPNRRRPATIGVWGNAGDYSVRDGLHHYGVEARRQVMGIDWMTGKELSESIPPCYTEFIGADLLKYLHFEAEAYEALERLAAVNATEALVVIG